MKHFLRYIFLSIIFSVQLLAQDDSLSPASTATIKAYTANPTIGTVIGAVVQDKILLNQSPIATTQVMPQRVYTFGDTNTQNIVLRGATEQLTINLNGATNAGNSFSIFVEYLEE